MTPQVTIIQGSCLDIDSRFVAEFDVMLTDPPYSQHVHKSATSQSANRGTRKRDLGFESLTVKARRAVALWASLVKRWSVVYSDLESFNWLALAAQAQGAEYVRCMPWVRWSMPQLSGDRPPHGFEALVCLHHAGARGKPERKRWNGPGNLTHLGELAMRGEEKHKCQKPLDQALRLVSYFSEPGETVFDPFAGAGTTAQACRILGRNCVSIELDEQWAAKAQARVTGTLSDSDRDRLGRWLALDDSPTAEQAEGPSVIRAKSRAEDKARGLAFLGA